MGLVEAILEGSSLVREVKEKAAKEGRTAGLEEGRAAGLEEGRAAGLEQGKTAEARCVLRRALKPRFPGLDQMSEIELISTPEALETLIEMAYTSTERTAVERAIAAAALPN